MADKIDLKVGIYPWIPDLDGDHLEGLQAFIKREFERQHPEVNIIVSANWDPYNADAVANNYLAGLFDVLEIDTVLLGEVADYDTLQPLEPNKYRLREDFIEVGVNAVTYKDTCYAIPTLHCANFLIELMSGNEDPKNEILCSLETGEHDLGDLKAVISKYRKLFHGVSPLVGDFRGKWTLPCFYLDAYIDKHGERSVQKGIDAPIESDVLDAMKWFMKLDEGTDGVNKGILDEYDGASERGGDIAKSDHVMLYGYSEYLSQVMADKMCKKKKIIASCIISPPLGAENNLLTFTDALIVSKSSYSTNAKRAEAIDKFILFFTSLSFRNKYAAGEDLKKPHPPRYVMISRKDFYTDGFGAHQKNYQKLREAMHFSVAAPNHGLAAKLEEMNRILVEKLGLPAN